MKLFKKVDHVLAALGNMKAMERTHVDTYTENKMKEIHGEKIAGNQKYGIWIHFTELAGFHFLEVTFLSHMNINTFKGIEISFLGGEIEMYIDSDTKEIDSTYSNVSNRWMTSASFEVTEEDITFINKKEYDFVRITHKKSLLNFKVLR